MPRSRPRSTTSLRSRIAAPIAARTSSPTCRRSRGSAATCSRRCWKPSRSPRSVRSPRPCTRSAANIGATCRQVTEPMPGTSISAPRRRDDVLRDAAGTLHARAGEDARIVCLVPSITELVCDLGLGDRLVGRTGFCIHPWETVRTIPKLGGTKDVKLERIRELRPTHAILNIDENRRELAEDLAEFVPHIVVTHPLGPLDNRDLYRLLGTIFRRQSEAERLCRG